MSVILLCRIWIKLQSAVTMTFDPFTLNICSTTSVMCSNSVQNLIKIEQSVAELLMIYHSIFFVGLLSVCMVVCLCLIQPHGCYSSTNVILCHVVKASLFADECRQRVIPLYLLVVYAHV